MAVKTVFERRLEPRFAELERLFMQLYDDRAALEELVDMLRRAFIALQYGLSPANYIL